MIERSSSLAPARLLGRRWECYAGTSAYGVLWRISRLNHFGPGHIQRTLRLNLLPTDNLLKRLTLSPTHRQHLASASDAIAALDNSTWTLDRWLPFVGYGTTDSLVRDLQVCPVCARSCYHTLLFQIPGIRYCPWHRTRLIGHCPRCKRPQVPGFLHGNPLGQCECGHDLTNIGETLEGDQASLLIKTETIDQYLNELSDNRPRIHAPEGEYFRAKDALAALIRASVPSSVHRLFATAEPMPPHVHLETLKVHRSSLTAIDLLGRSLERSSDLGQCASGLWPKAIRRIALEAYLAVGEQGGKVARQAAGDDPDDDLEGTSPEISIPRSIPVLIDEMLASIPFPDGRRALRTFSYPRFSLADKGTPTWNLMGCVYKRILLRGLAINSRYRARASRAGHPKLAYAEWVPWLALPTIEGPGELTAYIVWVRQLPPRWQHHTHAESATTPP